jgi:alpha-tubulin suppressor-like RCC1 family protein
MSEPKVQLIDPQGNISVTGLSAVGVLTASSLDGTLKAGSATGLTGTPNLSVGVVTASTFTGQGDGHAANLTGTPQLNLGVTTSTGFVGDAVGKAAGLTGTPNLNVGLVTATGFVGDVKGAITGNVGGNLTGNIDGNVTGNVTGNVEGDVTGDVDGDVTGNITGNIQGNVTGNVTGNLQGNVQGNVVGNLEGDVTGDVTGNIQGNVTGNVVGDLQGNVQGNVTGDIGGNVTGNVVGNLQGDVTGDVTGDIEGNVTGNVVGNLQGNVTGNVTGDVSGLAGALGINGINVWTGAGTSNLGVGVCTALQLYGDGSALTGTASSAYIAQNVTATSANTTIDLSYGNVIYYDATSNTTVAFSNPSVAEQITLIRDVDNDYTITWPDSVTWNGGSAPTLFSNARDAAFQIFHFTTGDSGTTYQAWEEMKNNAETFALYSWGSGDDGILAQNSQTKYSSPTQVPGTTWSTLAGGFAFDSRGGIKNDGTLWGWGRNQHGQLAQNNKTNYSSPIQIPGTTWANVSIGGDNYINTVAIKTDGTMWSWGGNGDGNLGINNRTYYSSPVQVPGTTWKDVSNGADWVLATKTDGTAWAWGKNSHGYLGLNNKTEKSSPTQIGSNDNWSYMAAGRPFNSMGVKTDGTLWSWGLGNNGALGHNNTTGYSSPKQILGTWSNTHPTKLTAGFYRGMAIKTDGTLWAWGYQASGELGQNNNTNYSSPRQIPGTTWESIDNMYNVTLATKTDGTLWSWGYNNNGELGQNSQVKYSSPVQVPGAWKTGSTDTGRTIAAGSDNSLALKVQ